MMVPAAAHARRVRAVEGEARAEDSYRRAALMVAAQRPDWAERWQACINRPARLRRVLLLPSRHRHKQHGLDADAEAAEVLRHCELDSRRASTVTFACKTNMKIYFTDALQEFTALSHVSAKGEVLCRDWATELA
jgi:hypothetical protein